MEMLVDLLEARRMELGMNQREFAQHLGFGQANGTWYSRVLNHSTKKFPNRAVEGAARVVGKTPEEIRAMLLREKGLKKGNPIKIMTCELSAHDLRYMAGIAEREGPLPVPELIQRLASRRR